MMHEKTRRSPRVRSADSAKQWSNEGGQSHGFEDNSEISSDEDENYEDEDCENDDYDDNRDFLKSPSSSASSEKSRRLESIRARSISKSPSVARSGSTETSLNTPSPSCRKATKDNSIDSKKQTNLNRAKCFVCYFVCPIIVCLVCFEVFVGVNSSSEKLPEYDERIKILASDMRDIKDKFPQQNPRSWSDIQAGVTDVMNSSSKPWTFVLFSNESTRISCLAELLGMASSKALLTENSLILRPEDMGIEYGDTIDRLRPLISERKAVVVHDVLNIDPGAIQAFHTMCDRENPLVKEAVYILTIIAPGYNAKQKPEIYVENLLTDRFIDRVHEDKLQPLITRLTDGPIIPVVPGNVPTGCFS